MNSVSGDIDFNPNASDLKEDVVFSDEFMGEELVDKSNEDLVVSTGTTKRIFPRTYKYRNIVIESDAQLIVEGRSRRWLIFICKNSVTIQGKLVYREFYDAPTDIQETAADGTLLLRPFDPTIKAGNGGKGGRHSAINQSAEGGNGVVGTRLLGGGGGGGGYFSGGRMHPGGHADGTQGGYPYKRGGNGGIQGRFFHGGLIYISAGDTIDAAGGLIDLGAENGSGGSGGENGHNPPGQYGAAGGGGGGGAPGGNGGILMLRAPTTYVDPGNLNLSGGIGGVAGAAGAHNGRPGKSGTTGTNGFVEFL